MAEVALAAEWAAAPSAPRDVLLVLEVGIAVVYARPFTAHGIGMIDRKKYSPPDRDQRRLHDRLIDLRQRIYAHTDETSYRYIAENVHDLFGVSVDVMGITPGSAVEIRVEALSPAEMPAVTALARHQEQRFRKAAEQARAAAPDATGAFSGRRFYAGGIPPTVIVHDDTAPSDKDVEPPQR